MTSKFTDNVDDMSVLIAHLIAKNCLIRELYENQRMCRPYYMIHYDDGDIERDVSERSVKKW